MCTYLLHDIIVELAGVDLAAVLGETLVKVIPI
jgi:hypothetical protein